MTDDEFDAWLARSLQEPAVPDRGFSDRVQGRLRRHRHARRLALGGVGVLTTLVALVSTTIWPPAGPPLPNLALPDLVATLILAAACGLVWLATESRGPAASSWIEAGGPHRRRG